VRDLAVMQEWGYAVERCVCVDQFVHTPHVESIALLSKLKSNKLKHINVELEMDELDLTAAESKATYEEIRDYVLEHSGLKVSSLYIAQVKQKCGIIERENYNLPKLENSRQPKCPPEKEKAIRDALEHFHMI
jgi:23S rRNA (uracil1939-C5)-methyltransferase